MKKFFLPALALMFVFIHSGCKKKVIEYVQVLEVLRDISIPDHPYAIVDFTFPDELNGYAVDSLGSFFKTVDGGKSWINLTHAPYRGSLYFLDKDLGFVAGTDDLWKTTDGGLSWDRILNFIEGAIVSRNGDIYIITENTWNDFILSVSRDTGKTYDQLAIIEGLGRDNYLRIENNTLSIISQNPYGRNLILYDLTTGEYTVNELDSYYTSRTPTDVFYYPDETILTYEEDHLYYLDGSDIRTYDWDVYLSLYSVDGIEDLRICTGARTILCNIKPEEGKKWRTVLDKNGNSFKESFYKVRFNQDRTLYLSGSKGTILHARL